MFWWILTNPIQNPEFVFQLLVWKNCSHSWLSADAASEMPLPRRFSTALWIPCQDENTRWSMAMTWLYALEFLFEIIGASWNMFQPLLHLQGLRMRIGMMEVDAVARVWTPIAWEEMWKPPLHWNTFSYLIAFCCYFLSIVILLTLSYTSTYATTKAIVPTLNMIQDPAINDQQISCSIYWITYFVLCCLPPLIFVLPTLRIFHNRPIPATTSFPDYWTKVSHRAMVAIRHRTSMICTSNIFAPRHSSTRGDVVMRRWSSDTGRNWDRTTLAQ